MIPFILAAQPTMIIERGTVVAVHSNEIIVEVLKTSACQSCQARHGCGQAVMAEWGNESRQQQKNHFRIPYQQPVQVGDQVELGMAEDTLSKVALLVYLLPLGLGFLGMLLGAVISSNEWLQLLAFTLFSGFGYLVLNRFSVDKSTVLIPKILRTYHAGKGNHLIASEPPKPL
jgi:sigma-E factor negative regulatory protein RseC